MVVNKYAKYVQQQPAPQPAEQAPAKPNKYAKYLQPVPSSDAVPRADVDAAIEEAAAAIPGGYEAFRAKPADPQRMGAMGYVQDPLAKSGYAKRAPDPLAPGVYQPDQPVADAGPQNNIFADIVRGLEAPVAGLTGNALERWARTTQDDPLRGAVEAVDFISPVDDAARTYQGMKQTGIGLIEGDLPKAGQGALDTLREGSFTAMQVLPGSMTARGLTGPARVAPTTLAGAERAAVQATRAPPVRSAPAVTTEPPKPFSAPAEPAGGGIVRRNADRIAGGVIGATVGGVGDAYAAPADGEGNGGPLNAGTGAAIGFFGPRAVASAASRGFRAAARPFRPAGMDERVAARAVRNALASGGIRTPEEAAAAFTARYGDKPASIADLTQEGVSTAAGLSRRAGATGEAARARGEDLLTNRAGRLERDIADTTGASPATITGDVDRMVALARQQATPAYTALREQNPFGSFASSRLEQLRDLDILRPHLTAVDRYRETLAATEGRVVGDFEYWDLVKRSLDDAEQAAAARNQPVPYDLDSARQAIVREVDALVPDYAAARQLGGEAPRMQEAFRQGQGLLGGRYTAEDVTRLAQGITGQQLTALQAGVIRSMVAKTEGPRGAMAALMAPGARQKLAQVFGADAADAMQARFAADAAIVNNATRMNPNVGSVTSQAQMGEGGFLPMAAEAIRAVRSPIEATLAAMSKGGSYSQAQRDLMGQMLLDGATPENLARIYGKRGGRSGGGGAPGGRPPTGGNPNPDVDMVGQPMPTPTTARQQPSPESVAQAQGQLRAARDTSLTEREQIGAWDGPAPQKPQSILAWVRSQGGINDRNYMSGDVRAIMGRANAMPGLINRQSGKGLDDIVAAAYHQGFDVDPDDANSLMRLIEEEVAGNPSYRIGAREEWDVYQEYLAARRGDLPDQAGFGRSGIVAPAVGAGIGATVNPIDANGDGVINDADRLGNAASGAASGFALSKGAKMLRDLIAKAGKTAPKAPAGRGGAPASAPDRLRRNAPASASKPAQTAALDLTPSGSPRSAAIGDARVKYFVEDGVLTLQEINVPSFSSGKGQGSRAIDAIIAQADAEGLPIRLIPHAYGHRRLSDGDLKNLYSSRGFKEQTGDWMRREPGASAASASKPPPVKSGFGSSKPTANALKVSPSGPSTASRMVAGGVVGGAAGSLGGDAQAQSAETTAQLERARKEREDVLGILADIEKERKFFATASEKELQKRLDREGFDLGPTGADGTIGKRTRDAINGRKAELDKKFDAARARLTDADASIQKWEKAAAFEGTRPNDAQKALREWGAILGALAGLGLGAKLRGGAVNKAAKLAPAQMAKANALLTPGPLNKSRSVAAQAGLKKQPANINEFWMMGGAKDAVPFEVGAKGQWKGRKQSDIMPPSQLYPNRRIRSMDVGVMAGGVAEGTGAQLAAMHLEDQIKDARELADKEPTKANLARVEALEDQHAIAVLMSRLGFGIAGGRLIGSLKMPYAGARPDVASADAERALLLEYLKKVK